MLHLKQLLVQFICHLNPNKGISMSANVLPAYQLIFIQMTSETNYPKLRPPSLALSTVKQELCCSLLGPHSGCSQQVEERSPQFHMIYFCILFFLRQKIRWAEVGVKLTLGKGIGAFGFSGLLLRDFRMIAWYQRALENIISADVISAEKQNHIARVTPGEKGPKQTSITTK